MKKISVITLHRVFNYGSVFQAYATQKFFQDNGYDTEIIDYIPSNWQSKNLLLNISHSRGFLRDNCYRLMRLFSVILKQRTFWGFLKRNLTMTRTYKSFEELCANPPIADIYCTGSDQVWNSTYCHMDPSFYLQFGNKKIKRIAYVSSFGNEELEEKEKAIVKPYLDDYSAISVRESSAVPILEDMGLTGVTLIDPTLQIPKEHWISMASKRLVKEKYLILMLLYNEDNNATEIAREIADRKGLKLVKISWEMVKPKKVDQLMTHRPPQDFLSLFYYADFVVTNSFHGLAFSINLNKQFVVIKRNEFNSRIESLLALTGLENRMVDSEYKKETADPLIDYVPVNQILDVERKKAAEYLEESLHDK